MIVFKKFYVLVAALSKPSTLDKTKAVIWPYHTCDERINVCLLCILKNARMPLFLHRKSNHIFIVWQHLVLV